MIENLRQIRSFITVARSGNFTRAATVLHISQSALTVQIQQLEAALGVTLFDRDKRNCRLSEDGARLLAPMEQLLVSAESISRLSRNEKPGVSGVVTVASMPSAASLLLPNAVVRLKKKFPQIRVHIRDVPSYEVVSLVLAGDADFGLAGFTGVHRDLLFETLRAGRLCGYVSRTHELAQLKKISLKELCDWPVITMERPASFRNSFDDAVEKAQLQYRPEFQVNQISTALCLAGAGLGVAILNEIDSTRERSERLVRIEIVNPTVNRPINLVRRRGYPMTPAAEALAGVLHSRSSD